MNFCRRCGTTLRNIKDHVFQCENDHILFANNSPTAGIFLVNTRGHILMAIRGIEPYKGMIDIFGGFLDGNETAEDAIARELREELCLEPSEYSKPELLGSTTAIYPFKGEPIPLLGIHFYAHLLTDRQLTPTDDVADIYEAESIENIDFAQLSGDDIAVGLQRLKNILAK